MSILDETVSVPRRTMTLFFLVDVSSSMSGEKIGSLNDAVENTLPIVGEISAENPDAEIKVAALKFSNGVQWMYSEPKVASEFRWQEMKAEGLTSLGAACNELNAKLSTKGYMKSASGSFAPVVILLSDGGPTDDHKSAITHLKNNGWFKAAVKVAIAIGNDADIDVLSEFTGNREAVFTAHNIDALKSIIRIVAVTSSQVASRSSSAGDTSKQEQVIEQIKEEAADVRGVEMADIGSQSYADEFE